MRFPLGQRSSFDPQPLVCVETRTHRGTNSLADLGIGVADAGGNESPSGMADADATLAGLYEGQPHDNAHPTANGAEISHVGNASDEASQQQQ